MTSADKPTLAALADRTDQLVSLPAVAMEVLRLTELEHIDAQALCECLESDPALAAKLLRAVNSSLYGLPREIASLREAIAIVGVQPLKMLVLGFALPDDLLKGVSGEALRRYWTETLTTATAARALAEAGWGRLGDEVLVAALMQGVGQLVLLRHLGGDYADLLAATANPLPMQPRRSPLPFEWESFGFTHRELSAELVRRWQLPERLAEAIDRQAASTELDSLEGDSACLAQSLAMANQLTRMVVGHDLQALGELLIDGERYCGLTKPQINTIVESLQSRVNQLAQAMAVDVDGEENYHDTLVEAHARLAHLAEQQAMRAMGEARSTNEIDEDERLAKELLTETNKLSAAMRVFLAGGTGPRTDRPAEPAGENTSASVDPTPVPGRHQRPGEASRSGVLQAIDHQVVRCRAERLPLSLVILEVSVDAGIADADVMALRGWLSQSEWAEELTDFVWAPLSRDRSAVMLPNMERTDANRLWNEIAEGLAKATPLCLNAGVAGVTHISRGFDSTQFLESAERCLQAAKSIVGPAIKSIEVF